MGGRYGVSAIVPDILSSLHTIIRLFCHYFRTLPENPHYTSSLNILMNHRQSGCDSDGSMWKTEQLDSAAVVGEVTSRAKIRTAVLVLQ